MMTDPPELTVTSEFASEYFANRLHTDVWDTAVESDRVKSLAWASVVIRSAFFWNAGAWTESAWAEPVRFAVCEEALWLLKLDPTEYPCLLHIDKLRYSLNDGFKQDVAQIIVNGYKVSENTFIYDTNDAQIIIEGIPQNAKALEVKYRISMIEDPFYEDILGILKKEAQRKLEEKQEFTYRLKRKAGIIKEDTLPEGFVRAEPVKSE